VNYKRIAYWTMITMLIVFSIKAVLAYPTSPTNLIPGQSSQYNWTGAGGMSTQAQAGNVTALEIFGQSPTLWWQGYYGNVTGRIVLSDAINNTMYAWELATPSGEIYATNSSLAVWWDNLTCVNFTADTATNHKINMTTLNVQYNMNLTADPANVDIQAFNGTFNSTFTDILSVGGNKIGDDDTDSEHCAMLYTFVDGAWQQNIFRELITFDNESALVFVSFLEDSLNGFENGGDDLHDFQMMVPEDGTPGQEAITTTYYFYVELE
jgi:hypothetical protein